MSTSSQDYQTRVVAILFLTNPHYFIDKIQVIMNDRHSAAQVDLET